MREKVGKSRNTVFFQGFRAPEGRKVGSLKRRVWHEALLQGKMYKTPGSRSAFEKVHAVVARSTFRSQNVQKTPCTDHFWRFRCRFVWQAQGIVDLVKSEQNVRGL